ncbi:unnamed protein product [Ilex paraguariensis]|uniref:Uncharacterized protein n=1 Tax=Ilex paraguariensis TaxID=185542 RepID=A0ABC8U4J0_9AQUA
MSKDRSVESLFSDASTVSSYSCNAEHDDQCKSEIPSLPVRDEEVWKEARCPICIEPPHNAVLLLCSFCDQHCHPYMCDTSYRHSNCLDQFCNSSGAALSTEEVISSTTEERESEEWMSSPRTRYNGKQLPKLVCPLCRGQVSGWVVIEAARHFMNSKPRSCSLETCDFNGNYSELRKHARLEHPSVCPSEADPKRLQDWTMLGRERDFEDSFSAYELGHGDGWSDFFIDRTVMEYERDLEDIEIANHSRLENWVDDFDWLADRVWHPSPVLPEFRQLYPWLVLWHPIYHPSRLLPEFPLFYPPFEPIDLDSSSGGDRSGDSRSTRSRATYHAETILAPRRGSNFSRGTSRSSNFSRGNSRSLREHRRLDQRQSRRNH